MKLDNLSREVRMYCPTCGGTEFLISEKNNQEELVTCTHCERKMTKSEVVEGNSTLLRETQDQIMKEAQKQLEKEVKKFSKKLLVIQKI